MTLINYIDHFAVTFLNPTYYADIMLDALNSILHSSYADIIDHGFDV